MENDTTEELKRLRKKLRRTRGELAALTAVVGLLLTELNARGIVDRDEILERVTAAGRGL